MNLIKDLISKGVSQKGAVEVLLGEPLSLQTDRLIVSRLAVPVARDSLSRPPAPKSLVGAPNQRVNQIVSAMSGMSVASAYMTTVVQRTKNDARPADPLKAQRVNALRNSIKNIEREIENLTAQLLRLAVPPQRMPRQVWEAQVRFFRNLIQSNRNILATLMKQLSDLTGESGSSTGSSTGSSAAGSTSSANQAYGSLQNTNKSNNNSGSIGSGA